MKLHFALSRCENLVDMTSKVSLKIQTLEDDYCIVPVVCVFKGEIHYSNSLEFKLLTNFISDSNTHSTVGMVTSNVCRDIPYESFVDLIEGIVELVKISEWMIDDKLVFNSDKEEICKSFASALFRVQPEPQKLTHSDIMAAAWGLTHLSRAKRLKVGAVLVDKDGKAVGHGYNHMPFKHRTQCCELNDDVSNPEVIHAEMDALVHVDFKSDGCTVFVTHAPCLDCAMAIVEAGASKVVYEVPYRLTNGIDYLLGHGVIVEKYDGSDGSEPSSAYVNQ